MRTWMLLIVTIGLLSTSVGCKRIWTHGVCDCEMDNHCYTRTPWPIAPKTTTTPGEAIPGPAKLPDGKKL